MEHQPVGGCRNCGARDEDAEGLGRLCWISDTSYQLLSGLFLGQLDDKPCPVCGQLSGIRPTVFVGIGKWQELLYSPGDRFLAAPLDDRNTFLEALRSKSAKVEAFADLNQLRAAYAKRVASMIGQMSQALQRMSEPGGLEELHAEGWRNFTSNYFAGVMLVLTTPLAGITVTFPNGAQDALDGFVMMQVLVWLAFCDSWSGAIEKNRTLEGDLESYLDRHALMSDAVTKFLEDTEKDSEDAPITYRFCVEAMRASLCVWSAKPNPRLSLWADLFVQQEIERIDQGDRLPRVLKAMEISAERARQTIPYEELFDAGVRQVSKDFRLRTQMGEIGRKVGYPGLEDELLSAVRFSPKGRVFSAREVLKQLRAVWKGGPPQALLMAATKAVSLLGDDPSLDALIGVADGLTKMLGDGIEVQALVDKWLCSHLYKSHRISAMLDRIGDTPRPWEHELPLELRAGLWTERSNALRMCGRTDEALGIAEAVMAEIKAANETIPPELRRNAGILYRETGQYERALQILLELLKDAPRDLSLLNSIVVTYAGLGRSKEVAFYLEAMLKLAVGPHAHKRSAIMSTLAAAKAYAGNEQEALALLRQVNLDTTTDPETLMSFASGWTTLLTTRQRMEGQDRQTLAKVIRQLKHLSKVSLRNGNASLNMAVNRLLALLLDLTGVGRPHPYWGLVDTGAREREGAPDLLATLALARDAWDDKRYETTRKHLLELPSAVSERYGRGQDTSLRILSLSNLNLISGVVVERIRRSGSLADLRLVSEVTRDLLGRTARVSPGHATPSSGFVDPNNGEVRRLGGPTAVFEWVKGDHALYGVGTFIAADGTATERDVRLPDIDLGRLAERITQRLSLWRADRSGSPLDLKDWQSFEKWLAGELEGNLPEGGRLVVIEHKAVAGLPWQLAAAPRWRVSYAPSWSALLTARRETPELKRDPIGLLMVPKYRESSQNLQALEGSASRTVAFTSPLDLELKSAVGEACNRQALVSVLEQSRTAKILCHGFVDPEDNVVALMVAHEGALPLGNSVAANTPSGRRHRFDWRDSQYLHNAPQVIFSAACGSGQSHHAGFGEQLGLFSTLRRAGTRSLIAPRWDIEPRVILPILDDAMERYVGDNVEPGEALHAACVEASSGLPRWHAWALALEGDWR